MLRIHDLQPWFGLSDPAMEEALHDTPVFREFAELGEGVTRLPDQTTIWRFRHLLEKHDLAADTLRVVSDILQARGPMTKKGNQWDFGMKAHIGVDADSGLVHTVNVDAATQAGALLHGEEEVAFGDAGHQGAHIRPDATGPAWHVDMRPGPQRELNPFVEPAFIAEQFERAKASVHAKVEHPFRVLQRQFGDTKFGYTHVRDRRLMKNTAQIVTLFAPGNLWMARRHRMGATGWVRPQRPPEPCSTRRTPRAAPKAEPDALIVGFLPRSHPQLTSGRTSRRVVQNFPEILGIH